MIHGWKDIPHAWTGRIKTVTMKHTSHGNPQIQHNPCEITNSIFHRTRIKKKSLKICTETHKTQKPKQSWKRKMEQEESGPCLQTTLQSYSHQKQHFLAQNRNKDEWNRIQSPEINHAPSSMHRWQRRQGYTVLEKQPLQQTVQRNLNSYIQKKKKEIRSFFNTTHKNKLKTD